MTTTADNSMRQAALFVQNLDEEAAEVLYARLSREEASRLRQAVVELSAHGEIDENDFDQLRAEVALQREQRQAPPATQHEPSIQASANPQAPTEPYIADRGGVALELGTGIYDRPTRRPQLHADSAAQSTSEEESLDADPGAWFASIEGADPSAVASYLASEQPRAIALVLSHLAPGLAAQVLSEFPEAEQTPILVQLSNLGEADPTAVRVLATGLAGWIRRQEDESRRRADRLSSLRAIVNALPEERRGTIAEQLQEAEPSLDGVLARGTQETTSPTPASSEAQPVKSADPPIRSARNEVQLSFDSLAKLDARTLAEALGTLTPRGALLALAGASDTLLRRIESGLARKAARELHEQLQRIGPATLAEIDASQRLLVDAAEQIVRSRRRQPTAA